MKPHDRCLNSLIRYKHFSMRFLRLNIKVAELLRLISRMLYPLTSLANPAHSFISMPLSPQCSLPWIAADNGPELGSVKMNSWILAWGFALLSGTMDCDLITGNVVFLIMQHFNIKFNLEGIQHFLNLNSYR